MNILEMLTKELKGCKISDGSLFCMITYKTEKQLSKIKASMYVLGIDYNIMELNNVVTFKK